MQMEWAGTTVPEIDKLSARLIELLPIYEALPVLPDERTFHDVGGYIDTDRPYVLALKWENGYQLDVLTNSRSSGARKPRPWRTPFAVTTCSNDSARSTPPLTRTAPRDMGRMRPRATGHRREALHADAHGVRSVSAVRCHAYLTLAVDAQMRRATVRAPAMQPAIEQRAGALTHGRAAYRETNTTAKDRPADVMEPMVNIALRAARNAGRVLLRSMDRVDTLTVVEKGRNDLVSEVDRRAEDVIVDTIWRSYPNHRIVGEEGGQRDHGPDPPVGAETPAKAAYPPREQGASPPDDDEYTWVIDPLDGTTNFLQRIPHYCTAIAVTRGPVLLHGVVVDHVRNEEFSASRGAGAMLNGRRIRVSRHDRLDDAVVAMGIPFAKVGRHLDTYSDVTRNFMQRCRSLHYHGSSALDLAYLAAGRVDGFFQIGLEPWDMAAGTVIVREAGGFVADAAGGERFLATGNVVAGNPRVFRDALRVVRQCAAHHKDETLQAG